MNPRIIVVARAVRSISRGVDEPGSESVVQPEFEGGIEMVRQALIRYQCDESTHRGWRRDPQ